MRTVRAVALLCLLSLWFVVFVGTALATDEAPSTTGAEAEVDADAPPDPNAPPVVVEDVEPEADDEPWTARFLAPATAVLGLVIFVIVVAYYFIRVRGRYEVVG